MHTSPTHPFNKPRSFSYGIGKSVLGRDVVAYTNFDIDQRQRPGNATLLIGGMHGDEQATVVLLRSFVERYLLTSSEPMPIAIIPLANPDGFEVNSRYNARGVDLNRNFGFAWDAASVEPSGREPWSEPETQALRDFIIEIEPAKIVSLHWALAEIDADGPQSTGLATRIWEALA